ncbi:hypothetical protein [Tissierella sp.]
MKCPKCGRDVNIKKNNLFNCRCGAVLIAVEIYKKLVVADVKNYKGEN